MIAMTKEAMDKKENLYISHMKSTHKNVFA